MSYNLYTSLLKMYDEFCPSDEGVRLSIDFSAPELTELRAKYSLASVVGAGTPFEKAVRLMEWLTAHVRHDGSCNPEGPRCAMNALQYAFDQPEKGVNCSWLATILTECLLSLGIAARTVDIVPFAPYDEDNHVITHVWTGEQWVMLDPTTNCYAMDKDGNFLDVFRLRALLADQQEILFSDGLRYNGQPYDAKGHRDYLAKDLFWFQMAEVSCYLATAGRTLVISPTHYDPKRRDLLNIDFRRNLYGDVEWLRLWRKNVESSAYIYCSIEDARKAP